MSSALTIVKGDTFGEYVVRLASSACVFKSATFTAAAPALITATSHGLTDGWPVYIENVDGINPKTAYQVKVTDANTLTIVCLNGKTLTAGNCTLRWYSPIDLSTYSARMRVLDKVGGSVLETWPLTVNNAAKTITLSLTPAQTAAIEWSRGVFDAEVYTAGDAYVKGIDFGSVAVKLRGQA